jgi:hypothetical protein
MKNLLIASFSVFFVLFLNISVNAESPPFFQSVREAGMGDCKVANTTKDTVLYANPAALTEIKGRFFNFAEFQSGIGADTLTLYNKILDISKLSDQNQMMTELGKLIPAKIFASPGLRPLPIISFASGNWGLATYVQTKLSGEIVNPVSPRLDLSAIADGMVIFGLAREFNPFLSLGASVKYLYRYASYDPANGTNLISLPSVDLFSIMNKTGTSTFNYYSVSGTGFDVGALFKIGGPVGTGRVGVAIQNLGLSLKGEQITKSSNANTADVKTDYSSTVPTVTSLGFSVDSPGWLPLLGGARVAGEYRMGEPNSSMWKGLHFGFEKHFWGPMDLRLGLNQGYTTYGIGINLLLFKLDYAYFIEEAGSEVGVKPFDYHIYSITMAI